MDKRDFDYDLPEARIAQAPLAERQASRLLTLDRDDGALADRRITDLVDLLGPNDLLVFNDTRVLAARLHGAKATGGAVEVMLERILDSQLLTAKIRANKPPRPDSEIRIGDYRLQVTARTGELYTLRLVASADSVADLLGDHGHMPLPPYIRRPDADDDRARYQTVWARHDGAVAAPTAGLHFDTELLDRLAARGVRFGYVTLHVGSGTYQRLREGDVHDQTLHAERVFVDTTVCEQIAATRAAGGRVIAVGTTAVRSLETAARAGDGTPVPYADETQLFIKPGDAFHVVDAVLTNFHEPQSSLLMLVAAFAGHRAVLAAYAHAVAAEYRFLSYGDAMFIA
ncbi:tRNA preQ1(34) S-adenosylmethionine ribosyltransferase-isomerase QueA [Salinisphaera sp. Q1T1-3]|uniref:tRNA preQ1(34) S-adenosylmethionine ribosyltransferase-isomerase QueA n=1 Tax=Salinisphaera sp. Q1T1-3 TaxID=2321229 RepID=UPI000E71D208|nr:tRNA preQ1(34) S-adenosylmethionine ribosyltransferase-isomerase QueA [Salinisphaera sp. Q1T1-3]RJS93308.1 tRNA preQ1(34) S-adenosylmethionine ribosyltransferase-isomerase QueA [Salinisphaera sp. Q1T1-3]